MRTKIVLILLLLFMLLWVFDLSKGMNDYRLANQKLSQELKGCQSKLPQPLAWDPKIVKGPCDRCCCMRDMGYCVKWCVTDLKPHDLMPMPGDSPETIKLKEMTDHACDRECNMKKEGYPVSEN